MAKLTEADKKDFVGFVIGILNQHAGTISSEGKKGVKFDTQGNKKMLTSNNDTVEKEEAREKALEEQKQKQTASANKALDAAYKSASEIADAVVAHMGNNHTLSGLIRKQRGSMHQGGGNQSEPTPLA